MAAHKIDIQSALVRYGPSPIQISRATNLPVALVKSEIVNDDDLRAAYQSRLQEVHRAIGAFGFDMRAAAEFLGFRRRDLEDFVHENPVLGRAVEDLRLETADLAEVNLRRALERGEWNATQFVLERSQEGGRRGYGKTRVSVEEEAAALDVDPKALRDRLVRALLVDRASEMDDGKQDV